ncbi:MAG: extracellular solute-binding protein [Planctomycetota bacterium]|nr:extracellular solute-binding protein [Planctomycetota bacterium]
MRPTAGGDAMRDGGGGRAGRLGSDGRRRPAWLGFAAICAIAVVSSVMMLARREAPPAGASMWLFARLHRDIYVPAVEDWNRTREPTVRMSLLGVQAMEQRTLSSFLSGTRSAELMEVERRIAARAFAGPVESVGFLDLTDRLREEGLLEAINASSFTPWTSRGRIFGLPHDVHPVMLGYRADIVEAAGIDVSTIETWDDFVRTLRPLMYDAGGAKRTDRYLLNLWETHQDVLEMLLLQAGGGIIDERGLPMLDAPVNARVLARAVSWGHGPDRIAADAPYFSAAGNRLLLDGYVLASFVPDWMCNIWRKEIPELGGKVKLMPLPAWEKGGRRTSAWGGTMLGISRDAPNPEECWAFAKHLYLSPELSRRLYTEGDIITPVKAFWSDPVFDEPDAYFGGQARGRAYINLAPQTPPRYNSPFSALALDRLRSAATQLAAYADAHPPATPESLEPEAARLLKAMQADIMRHVRRNRFFAEDAPPDDGVQP